ncbi:MAG: sulfatase/phosphatase domain-containing protein, partial [Rubripirellula sp.]
VGNTPFRWYKQNQHEGGITSPMIVSGPGLKAKPGSVTDQPAHLIDLMATCIDVSKADYPTAYAGRAITPLQGRTLTPILAGKVREPHPWLYFQFSNNRALRQGDLKAVSVKGRPWELYDLAADRSELNDLAKSRPDTLEALKKRWHDVAENTEHAPANLRRPVGVAGKQNNKKKKNRTRNGKSD